MSKQEMSFLHDNPDIEKIHVAAQPNRLAILNLLTTKNDKIYASKIGELLGIERKVVAFHLNALENVGLVKSEYGLTKVEEGKRPVAAKYYKLTTKGKNIYERVMEAIKQ